MGTEQNSGDPSTFLSCSFPGIKEFTYMYTSFQPEKIHEDSFIVYNHRIKYPSIFVKGDEWHRGKSSQVCRSPTQNRRCTKIAHSRTKGGHFILIQVGYDKMCCEMRNHLCLAQCCAFQTSKVLGFVSRLWSQVQTRFACDLQQK